MLRVHKLRSVAARASNRRAFSAVASDAAASAYRRYGHLQARLDPLGLKQPSPCPELQAVASAATPDAIARLSQVYCGAIGAEVDHLDSMEERNWWAAQLESQVPGFELSLAAKKNAWSLMEQAEAFELFLQKKFSSFKRYSGEGTEALLPAVNEIFSAAAGAGVGDVVIGMAHRGRLALLASLLNYPAKALFWKIQGNDDIPRSVQGIDDVSSHVAASTDRVYPGGRVHVSLTHNPSHLEFVNPVAAGKVRAKRAQGSKDAMCLLIHGDAAVSGQVSGTFAARDKECFMITAAAYHKRPSLPMLRYLWGICMRGLRISPRTQETIVHGLFRLRAGIILTGRRPANAVHS